ncbi:flavoprotein [Nocardioidaceae bacterium SCSIO 66511]|nr:flavoprotein [Nocardioidaceae bacterium SCSIO 66511]
MEKLRVSLVAPLLERGHQVSVVLTPTAAVWMDENGEREKLADLTGLPVRSQSRLPSEASPHPKPDVIVAAPATSNTVAKLALGIADTQALTVLCENVGTTPMVVFPRINAAHARQPAWESHLEALRKAGVHLIYGEDVWPLHEPRAASPRRELPWPQIIQETECLLAPGASATVSGKGTSAQRLVVAGRAVEEPLSVLMQYALEHGRTLRSYDHGGVIHNNRVTSEDVAKTRVFGSRISNAQAEYFVNRGMELAELWERLPPESSLLDADPAVTGGLYDAAAELFNAFVCAGIRWGKVSKVLHLKRPDLFPVLDSTMARVYRYDAELAAQEYPQRGKRRLYWAAIRNDLATNSAALDELQQALVNTQGAESLAGLSRLRLLDIAAWAQ